MGTIFPSDPYKWFSDETALMSELVKGNLTIHDQSVQERLLNWMGDEQYNHFRNLETGENRYALVRRRGNKAYAAKKTQQKRKLCRALDGKEFDYPVGGRGNVRFTRLLFVTVNFDRERFTAEEAWYALRSKPSEDCDIECNLLNKLNANFTKIFGKHYSLTCKEAQSSGYPAPHMILLLDKPVKVKLHGSNGRFSWRIDDPRILRRIGKDPIFRKLTFKNHRKAIGLNPIWKNGFIDFQGIVKGYKVHNKRDAFTYAFKYLTKCLSDSSGSIENLKSIDNIEDPGLRTALFTHLGNKCFRTRDLTFTKKFLAALGSLEEEEHFGGSQWRRIETIPAFVYQFVLEREQKKNLEMLKELRSAIP